MSWFLLGFAAGVYVGVYVMSMNKQEIRSDGKPENKPEIRSLSSVQANSNPVLDAPILD